MENERPTFVLGINSTEQGQRLIDRDVYLLSVRNLYQFARDVTTLDEDLLDTPPLCTAKRKDYRDYIG